MSELTASDIHALVGTDSPTLLEIGCNDGTDTKKFLAEMPKAKIICFECDPRAIDRFYRQGPVGIHLVQAAVCDVDGTVKFHGSSGQPPEHRRNINHYTKLPEWDLSGSLYEPSGHLDYSPWVTFPSEKVCQVRATRLDTWKSMRPDIDKIDFMWVDVQGAEASVILGASKTLAVTRYFYTECYDRPMYAGQVSLDALRSLLVGFEFSERFSDNVLFKSVDC